MIKRLRGTVSKTLISSFETSNSFDLREVGITERTTLKVMAEKAAKDGGAL